MSVRGSRTASRRTIDLTSTGSAPRFEVLDGRDASPPFPPSVAYMITWHHERFEVTLSVDPGGFPEHAQWLDYDASIHDGDRSRSIRFEQHYRLIAGPRVSIFREVTRPGWWDPVAVGRVTLAPEDVPTLQIEGAGLSTVASFIELLFDRYSQGWSFRVPR